MPAPSCILIPEAPNGEPSKLYSDLSKKINDRSLTNLIYASYLVNGVAAQMDVNGKRRGKQGEHRVNDVMAFFDVKTLLSESVNVNRELDTLLKNNEHLMEKDATGVVTKDINDIEEALKVCADFNSNHKGLVATVFQQGDKFRFFIDQKTNKSLSRIDKVKANLFNWGVLKDAFSNIGIDLDILTSTLNLKTNINPTRPVDSIKYIDNVLKTRNGILTNIDVSLLLSSNLKYSGVDALINRSKWGNGSIEVAVQKVTDVLRNPSSYSDTDRNMVDSVLDSCKKELGKIDTTKTLQDMNDTISNIKTNSENTSIETKLQELDNKYGINSLEYQAVSSNLSKLSQIAANAVMTLKRERDVLIKQKGSSTEVSELEKMINNITKALAGGSYYMGCINFLKQANDRISTLDDLMKSVLNIAATTNSKHDRAESLLAVNDILKGYRGILEAFTNIDKTVTVDENISDADKATIKKQAEIILKEFDRATVKYSELSRDLMVDYARDILGNVSDFNIRNIVDMLQADASMMEMFYSLTDMTTPVLSILGKIISEAQDARNVKSNEVSRRIREATSKLFQTESNTRFMYESDGYTIISDIDWNKYNQEKRNAYVSAVKSGLQGYALKEHMDNWEEAHTEDRIVDKTNGRTERVPNFSYRKPFPQLTQAQQEYYDTMMQLKGELGSMLPEYAQKQYLAPQARESFWDTVLDSKDLKRALKNSVVDIFTNTIREDNTDFWRRGVIDGEEYGISQGGMDNTPLRQIPIFYINKINSGKDGRDVLKNFSEGLAKLAGVAINYDCLSKVRADAEFIQLYVQGLEQQATDNNNTKQAEVLVSHHVKIIKKLTEKHGNSFTNAYIAAIIDSSFFGRTTRSSDYWHLFTKRIIGYTSLKALSTNLRGFVTNYFGALIHTIIEAGGGEFYNFKDLAWAFTKCLGDATIGVPGHLYDFITNNRQSYDTLVMEFFDFKIDNFKNNSNASYHKGLLRKILGLDFLFGGYSIGEFWVHKINAYSMLHSKKIIVDRKKTNLYEVFELEGDPKNPKLKIRDSAALLDGTPITWEYLNKYRKLVGGVAEEINGGMSDEAKGIIHQYCLGKMIMNLRQWAPATYGRRFRGRHYNAKFESEREGYKVTMYKFTKEFIKDYKFTAADLIACYDNLDSFQQANVRKNFTGLFLCLMSVGIDYTFGWDDDKRKRKHLNWLQRFGWIIHKRVQSELFSTDFIPAITENFSTMINSPIPSVDTFSSLTYPLLHIDDIDEYTGRGRNKENLYWKNIKKYTLPFFKDIQYYQELEEDPNPFSIFQHKYQNK